MALPSVLLRVQFTGPRRLSERWITMSAMLPAALLATVKTLLAKARLPPADTLAVMV